MARRSDHSREEVAAMVAAAARALVAAEGAGAVTMRGIAARIGYAPGSIYNAVGDLEQVLLRVNAATLAALGEELRAAVAGEAAAPLAVALRVADAYMDYVAAHARLWTAVLDRVPAAGQPVPPWYAAPRAALVEIVAGVLAPLYPEAAERRRAVVALWAALQGVAALAAGGNLAFAAEGLEARDIARSIVRRYLTGREDAA